MISTTSREALEEYATALTATIEELTAVIDGMRDDLACAHEALWETDTRRGAPVLCRG
jgi:hypothetical protein